mmetsp:Transcript_61509/g.194694  ORF Transcript_61509/g.194694 Transcript_61509/m.194694 type:complete len:346 (-) Transcript_61509:92-1129(-)
MIPTALGAAAWALHRLRRKGPRVLVVSSCCRTGGYLATKLVGPCREVHLHCLPRDYGEPFPLQEIIEKICTDAGVVVVKSMDEMANKKFDFIIVPGKSFHIPAIAGKLREIKVRARHVVTIFAGIMEPSFVPPAASGGKGKAKKGGGGFEFEVDAILPQVVDLEETAGGDGLRLKAHMSQSPMLVPPVPGADAVAQLFQDAGVGCRVEPGTGFYYKKLRTFLRAAATGALSVVTGCDYRELLAHHKGRMGDLFDEAKEVLQGPYLEAYQQAPAQLKESTFSAVEGLGFTFPQENLDWKAGRPLDVEGTSRYVQARGRADGAPTPDTDVLLQDLQRVLAKAPPAAA